MIERHDNRNILSENTVVLQALIFSYLPFNKFVGYIKGHISQTLTMTHLPVLHMMFLVWYPLIMLNIKTFYETVSNISSCMCTSIQVTQFLFFR